MAGLGTSIRIANAYVQLDVRGQRRMESLLARAAKSVAASARQMRKFGLAAVAMGGAALVGFAKAVQGASDLREQTNKAIEVFGGSAQTVISWSNTTAKAFGIAKREALAYSSELGLIIQQSGKTKKESVALSISMSELAADLASFNNVEIATAFDKLKSGLVGESKPLREFGILLNESEVASKALALGFKKVNGELTESAKVSARYALILEQSKNAQGDFARTADDLANATRILKAVTKDAADAVGTALIPTFTLLIQRTTEIVGLFGEFAESAPRVTKTVFGVALAVTVAGAALVAAGTAAGVFSFALTNLTGITSAATFVQLAFTSSVLSATAAVTALQFALAGLAFFIGYQIGSALADMFFNATESAKKLNEEIQRSQILSKGLDEVRLKNLRRVVLETGNVIGQEHKLRGEYVTTQQTLARSKLSLEEFKKNPIAAQRGQRARNEQVRGLPVLEREIAEMERLQAIRKEVLDEAQAIIDQGRADAHDAGEKAAKDKSTRYVDQLKLLERMRVEMEKGALAAQAWDDSQDKDLTPKERTDLATKRAALDADTKAKNLAEEKAATAKQIRQSGIETLKQQQIQLTYQKHGALEVEKQLNIMRGMSPILAEQIRAKKEQVEVDQEIIDKAQENADIQQGIKDDYKSQKRELELQLIALRKGEEAAERARDKDKGFSKQQRQDLAKLRKEKRVEEEKEELRKERMKELEKKSKDGKDGMNSLGDYFGGGFAQRLAIGTNTEETAREQRKAQVKLLRKIATAYNKAVKQSNRHEKSAESWRLFLKSNVYNNIVSR